MRQRLHHLGIAVAPQPQEVVVLAHHLVTGTGEVQGEGRHVAAEVVDPENQILRQVLGPAPHDKPDAGIGQPILVAADVDRHHAGQPKIPYQVRMQKRHHKAPTGRVDVYRDVHTPASRQFVQRGADLGDGFEFTGIGGAQDRHHADGVLVDGGEHLLGGDDVAAPLHRQVTGFDVEVAAELLPHHLDVRTHHQIGHAPLPRPHPLPPTPFQGQPTQHHRLAGADGGHPGGAGGVVVAQTLGVKQVGDHGHTARLDGRGRRVFVLIDHVLVERLGHQLFGLRVHPGGHEGGQIQPRATVEHQLVVDEAIGPPRDPSTHRASAAPAPVR